MPQTLDQLPNDLTHYTEDTLAAFAASALLDALDGLDSADLQASTGMPQSHVDAIFRLRAEIVRRQGAGLRFASFHDKPGADRAPEAPNPTEE